MRHRHAVYLATVAEEGGNRLDGVEQSVWLKRLEQERPNLTAALIWCAEVGESDLSPAPVAIGLQILSALWRFWEIRGGVRQARAQIEHLIAQAPADLPPLLLARAFNTAGTCAQHESDYPAAMAYFEKALAIRRQAGQRDAIGSLLSNMGNLYREQKDVAAALRCFEESLAIARELENSPSHRGDTQQHRDRLRGSGRIRRRAGSPSGVAHDAPKDRRPTRPLLHAH